MTAGEAAVRRRDAADVGASGDRTSDPNRVGVPAAVAIGGAGLWRLRPLGSWGGVASVFVAGYLLATALFVVWSGMNGWTLPQFSEVGIL
jgi:hypothetical protein